MQNQDTTDLRILVWLQQPATIYEFCKIPLPYLNPQKNATVCCSFLNLIYYSTFDIELEIRSHWLNQIWWCLLCISYPSSLELSKHLRMWAVWAVEFALPSISKWCIFMSMSYLLGKVDTVLSIYVILYCIILCHFIVYCITLYYTLLFYVSEMLRNPVSLYYASADHSDIKK